MAVYVIEYMRTRLISVSCLVIWIYCLLSINAIAQAEPNDQVSIVPTTSSDAFKKQFLITYVEYPQTEKYLQLLKEIYTELGFKVHLIPAPALRGLAMLDKGKVDADAYRFGRIATQYKNVTLVKPELIRGSTVLLCRQEVSCDITVLSNRKNVILTNERTLLYLADFDIRARLLKKEVISNTLEMLRSKRVNYATFMIDQRQIIPDDLKMLNLRRIFLYHVISNKHANLLPKIEKKLRQKQTLLNRTVLGTKP